MAELLYYENPSLLEFDAEVISAAETGNGWEVILDRTCFYPEGGGQPADLGMIGGSEVIDVQKRDGEVFHILANDPGEGQVRCILDSGRRRDYMQQHTGQHIISAALVQTGGFATVSVHQGEEFTTIEIEGSAIAGDDLINVERIANEIIGRNLPVRTHWVSDSELSKYPLRRPSKVSGNIRLVEIENTDWVACGGVHAERTGFVGLVKAVGVETIRGNARIAWKIGDRAYADYAVKDGITSELISRFSAKPDEIVAKVDQLLDRNREAEYRARQLSERVAGYEVDRLLSRAGDVIAERYEDEAKDFLLTIMKLLMEKGGVRACLVNVSEGRVQWSVGGDTIDFNALRDQLLTPIEGKGGGKPPMWQGVGSKPDGIPAMFDVFNSL